MEIATQLTAGLEDIHGLTIAEQTEALNKINDIQSSASEIDNNIFCNAQVSAIKYELVRGLKNLKILAASDSTGNASNEFIYYFTEWIAENFTKYTAYWYEWDDTLKDYKNPISFGSGAMRVDLFCFGVGGTRPDYLFQHWNNAVVGVLDINKYPNTAESVDLILCNHSHNLYDELDHLIECRYEEVIEELLLMFENAGVVMVHQNAYRDDDTTRLTSRNGLLSYARRRGFAIADANKLFYDLNKDSSLYADNVHPTVTLGTEEAPTGTRLFLISLTSLFHGNPKITECSNKSMFSSRGVNLLVNGNLKTWTNSSIVPDYFYPYSSGYSSLLMSKDETVWETTKEGLNGYSIKIETTGSNQSRMDLTTLQCGSSRIKNTWVTLGIRVKKNSDSTSNGASPMRLQLKTTSQTLSPTSYGFSNDNEKWVWKIARAYVGNDGVLSATFFIDASVSTGFIINIDRIVLCKGMSLVDC